MQAEEWIKNNPGCDYEFFRSYFEAINDSQVINSIEHIKALIDDIISWDKLGEIDKDPLTLFIRQSLKNGVPNNRFTWVESIISIELQFPWIIILDQVLFLDVELIKTLDWCTSISGQKMLIIKDWFLSYCDISNCPVSPQENNELLFDKLLNKYKLVTKLY